MNDYAVVLQDGRIVKASNFTFTALSDITFTNDGKVSKFTYQGVSYYSVYEYSSKAFLNYVDEVKFNALYTTIKAKQGTNYTGVGVQLWNNLNNPSMNLAFQGSLTLAQPNDDIYGKLRDDTGLCFNYYTWKYTTPYNGPVGYILADGAPTAGFDCIQLSDGIQKSFYNQFIGESFYDLDSDTAEENRRLVGEIASLMQTVNQQTLQAFNNFVITGLTDGPNIGVFSFQPNNDGSYSQQDLIDYENGLKLWLQIFKNDQDELEKLTDPNGDPNSQNAEKTYILCDLLYRYNMLTLLSVDLKIGILKTLCHDALIDWYFASYKSGFQQRESLVVKIIKSVTNSQVADDPADDFLGKLTSNYVITQDPFGYDSSVDTATTLYQTLFYKVDDFFGPANFTTMIYQLAHLTLVKNNITIDPSTAYSIPQLQAMAKAHFFWGDIKNGNEVEYSVLSNTATQITYNEKICIKSNLVPVYYPNSAGISTFGGYESRCAQFQNTPIQVNHFDVVAIHFYSNPSFVDTSSTTSMAGQSFLTFGGFVSYLLEKEDTQTAINIMQAGLFLITLAAGFGEIAAAVRSVSIARALVGAMIISGDASTYLSTNNNFKNYIVSKYPNNYNQILTFMQSAGAIATLGGTSGDGSGILSAFSKEDAGGFIGTATQVLADPTGISMLTENDVNILNEGLIRFENGIFTVQSDPDIVNGINQATGEYKFFDNDELRTQILNLSSDEQIIFYNAFNPITAALATLLKQNPEAVFVWSNLTATGQLTVENDLLTWLNSFQVRSLIINQQYSEIAQLYGKTISNSYEVNSLPGIKWIIDGTPNDTALIDANNIANDSSDIQSISSNYNIPLNVIIKAKSHYWSDEQILLVEDGTFQVGRFEKDESDISEWNSAIANRLTADQELSFRRLIVHEYIEAKLMDKGMKFSSFENYSEATPSDFGAHDIAPKVSDGTYLPLERSADPPLPDINGFSNLDAIVDFYTNFYQL